MIRPSGGKLKVDVRHFPRRFLAVLQGFAPYMDPAACGPWIWRIPYPKGHPKPPPINVTYGRAPTQAAAIAAGMRALERWYPPELSKYPCPKCNYEQLTATSLDNRDPDIPVWRCPRCRYFTDRKITP